MAEFRIEKDEVVNKTIRMKITMIDEITTLATANNISFNALVVQMCKFALENLPRGEGDDGADDDEGNGKGGKGV